MCGCATAPLRTHCALTTGQAVRRAHFASELGDLVRPRLDQTRRASRLHVAFVLLHPLATAVLAPLVAWRLLRCAAVAAGGTPPAGLLVMMTAGDWLACLLLIPLLAHLLTDPVSRFGAGLHPYRAKPGLYFKPAGATARLLRSCSFGGADPTAAYVCPPLLRAGDMATVFPSLTAVRYIGGAQARSAAQELQRKTCSV